LEECISLYLLNVLSQAADVVGNDKIFEANFESSVGEQKAFYHTIGLIDSTQASHI